MNRWVGKVAVVTGASSGIGRDIARGLAEQGLIVVGLARRKERIEELAATVKGKIHALKCDLSVESEILESFKWIKDNLGGVDILVNNAGLNRFTALSTGPTSSWKAIMDVNVMGLCICTREALRTMRERGDNGHIFHINSIAGHYPLQYETFPVSMYCASKHAVTSLTESLRVELRGKKSNIRITSISPGGVHSEIVESSLKNIDTSEFKMPSKEIKFEMIDPEDITEALIYALGTRPKVQECKYGQPSYRGHFYSGHLTKRNIFKVKLKFS